MVAIYVIINIIVHIAYVQAKQVNLKQTFKQW